MRRHEPTDTQLVYLLIREVLKMAAELDALQAAVAANTAAVSQAVAKIDALKAGAGVDPAAVQAAADQVAANNTALNAATS